MAWRAVSGSVRAMNWKREIEGLAKGVASIVVLFACLVALVRLLVPFVWGLDFFAAPALAVVVLVAGLCALYFLAFWLFRQVAKHIKSGPRKKV